MAAAAGISTAMTALSKVKARTWRAMEGAMQEVKNLADPMDVIRSALAFTTPILKVIGALLKLLGASVLQSTLESIKKIIALLVEKDTLEGTAELGRLLGAVITPALQALLLILSTLGPGIVAITDFFNNNAIALRILRIAVAPMANLLLLLSNKFRLIYNGIRGFLNPIIEWLNKLLWITGIKIPTLPYMYGAGGGVDSEPGGGIEFHGSRQYGGDILRTGYYRLHKGEEVTPASKTSKKEIHIHIDLRNAVVDNVDSLATKIAEQVLIQVG